MSYNYTIDPIPTITDGNLKPLYYRFNTRHDPFALATKLEDEFPVHTNVQYIGQYPNLTIVIEVMPFGGSEHEGLVGLKARFEPVLELTDQNEYVIIDEHDDSITVVL